ncbi:MAG: 50S ribosome-binding GTPase [Trueperella sp.]|nr:50S ribosome-binding GTPase [Trueperella sp.]
MELNQSAQAQSVVNRLDRLQAAVQAGGPYFDPFVSARAQEDLRAAEERMQLGLDLTVAALVGGTGSGKSTLFNALTELNFADAGELRPTTERATACTWNVNADEMLDYLEVDESRRIEHESILTAGHNYALDGLVLLDLPDHDSVRVGHSHQVSRLIPMVDLLVWVLDPQKYADDVLHQGYLASLKERQDAMVVVLNQIDTIAEEQRPVILADLRKLLDEDGLPNVPILTASALYGQGISQIRDELRQAVSGTSAAAITAAAELDAIAGRLRQNLGATEPEVNESSVSDITEQVMNASGIPAVVESIKSSGGQYRKAALATPEQPANTMVVAIRDAWVAHLRSGMPPLWQDALAGAVTEPNELRRKIGEALHSVSLPRMGRITMWLLALLATVMTVGGIVLAVLGYPYIDMDMRILLGVGGVALGTILIVLSRSIGKMMATREADAYGRKVRKKISAAIAENMVAGPRELLDRHQKAREALDFAPIP